MPATAARALMRADVAARSYMETPSGAALAVVVHDLDVVAVGVEHEGAVVAGVVDLPLARAAVVAMARIDRGAVERLDRGVARRGEGDMHVRGRLAADERERAVLAGELREARSG